MLTLSYCCIVPKDSSIELFGDAHFYIKAILDNDDGEDPDVHKRASSIMNRLQPDLYKQQAQEEETEDS